MMSCAFVLPLTNQTITITNIAVVSDYATLP